MFYLLELNRARYFWMIEAGPDNRYMPTDATPTLTLAADTMFPSLTTCLLLRLPQHKHGQQVVFLHRDPWLDSHQIHQCQQWCWSMCFQLQPVPGVYHQPCSVLQTSCLIAWVFLCHLLLHYHLLHSLIDASNPYHQHLILTLVSYHPARSRFVYTFFTVHFAIDFHLIRIRGQAMQESQDFCSRNENPVAHSVVMTYHYPKYKR